MSEKNLPLFGAAILLWLPQGESPQVQPFDPSKVTSPPSANPEPWWLLHEAITYAMTVQGTHGKLPWIKVGEEILDPDQIRKIFDTMGNLSGLSSRPDYN